MLPKRVIRFENSGANPDCVAIVRPSDEQGLLEGRKGKVAKFGGYAAMKVTAEDAELLEAAEVPAEIKEAILAAYYEPADPSGENINLRNVNRVKDPAGVIVMRALPRNTESLRMRSGETHNRSYAVKEYSSVDLSFT
jgi:hypothetical protein